RAGQAPPGVRRLPARRPRPRRGDRATRLPAGPDRGARRDRGGAGRGLAGVAPARRGPPRGLRPLGRRRARGPRRPRPGEEEGGSVSLYEEVLDDLEAGELSVEFEGQEPQALLEWAFERFSPRIAISTAFQIDGSLLIDMAYSIDPNVKVFTVD